MDDPLSAWFLHQKQAGFQDDRKGEGFAETGTAGVLVVVLCPAFLVEVPFGCVWEGRKRGVCEVRCEVAVMRSCGETDAVELFWNRVGGRKRERRIE